MNVGATTGSIASAAGAPLSQTTGSETERARDSAGREKAVDAKERSEQASGIGTTQEDSESSERDADGRRLWEENAKKGKQTAVDAEQVERKAKDPTGMSGNSLDLTG